MYIKFIAMEFNMPLVSSSVHIHNVRLVSYKTLDPTEVRKFQVLANKWWDNQGEFALLHSMNELRVPFIRSVFNFLVKIYDVSFFIPLQMAVVGKLL